MFDLLTAALKAKKKADRVLTEVEAASSQIAAQIKRTKAEVSAAAREYAQDVRRQRISALTLDDVRRLAPGVRLQPLRERNLVGVQDLLPLGSSRLQSIPGIGAATAERVFAAVRTLVAQADSLPVPDPPAHFVRESPRRMLAAIHIAIKTADLLDSPRELIDSFLQDIRPRGKAVAKPLSLARSVVGAFGKGDELRKAIQIAEDYSRQITNGSPLAQAIDHSKVRLQQVASIQAEHVTDDELAADRIKRSDAYKDALATALRNGIRVQAAGNEREIEPERADWRVTAARSDSGIPPFSQFFPTEESMSRTQRRYFNSIEGRLKFGECPESQGNISYVFAYVYKALARCKEHGFDGLYEHLIQLAEGYAKEPKLAEYCRFWAYDCLLGLRKYELFLEKTDPPGVAGLATHWSNLRLNVQEHCGFEAGPVDIVRMFVSRNSKFIRANGGLYRDCVVKVFERAAEDNGPWFAALRQAISDPDHRYPHSLFQGAVVPYGLAEPSSDCAVSIHPLRWRHA